MGSWPPAGERRSPPHGRTQPCYRGPRGSCSWRSPSGWCGTSRCRAQEAKRTFASAYCEAVGFGFLNPLTPILFAATTPSVLGHVSAPVPALVAGIFLGSLGWWIALSTAVSLLRRRVTFRSLNLANKVAGLLMAVLAVGMLGKGAATLRPSSPDRGAEPIEARHEDPG